MEFTSDDIREEVRVASRGVGSSEAGEEWDVKGDERFNSRVKESEGTEEGRGRESMVRREREGVEEVKSMCRKERRVEGYCREEISVTELVKESSEDR